MKSGRYSSIATLLAVLIVAPARSQVVQPDLWGTDGDVTSIARIGDTVYIAGFFTAVGPATGGAVPLDRSSGSPPPRFPRVNGIVHAVVDDGEGGWFVGGDFSAVEGEPHRHVAHLRADGRVDPWDPHIEDVSYVITSGIVNPIHTVSALALSGDVLYIGGRFEVVGGRPHRALVAVNTVTGEVLDWDPRADGAVTALAAERGSLFVGGSFRTVAGRSRAHLASFRLADGRLTSWDPGPDGPVLTIAIARDVAWIGGEFDRVGGQPRNSIAAVTLDTGAVTPWDAGLIPLRQYIAHGDWVWPYVSSIVIRGSTLFAGGSFDIVGGASRHTLAELDLRTARATAFDARIGAGLTKTLALHGQTLYVGGYLYDFGGQARPNLAALDIRTGTATSWNPRANGIVLALAVAGNTVLAGGQFNGMGPGQPAPGLAALDATTGRALPWTPRLDPPYHVTIAAGGGRLYASGWFTRVDGQPRAHLAAFDGATGALTSWNPWTVGFTDFNADLTRLATIGDTVYVAMPVDRFNGEPRHGLFALDGTTGAVLPWAPEPRGYFRAVQVKALSASEGTLWVAGEFDTIGGAPRWSVGQVEQASGRATAWALDDRERDALRWFYAQSVVSDGPSVFVGGWFYPSPGHMGLLAFDRAGRTIPAIPGLQSQYHSLVVGQQPVARALALDDGMLYLGGRFDSIGTVARADLGSIDATTGAVSSWDPDLRGGLARPFDAVATLTVSDDVLYVGGRFTRFGGYPARGLAAVRLDAATAAHRVLDAPASEPRVAFALAPNPARGRLRLTYSLPAPATVSLSVHDVAGRRVATLLSRSTERAGEHALFLDTARLRAGIYFGHLVTGSSSVTRRFVVLD